MCYVLLAVIDGSNDLLGTNYVAKYRYEVRVWDNSNETGNINATTVTTTTMISTM